MSENEKNRNALENNKKSEIIVRSVVVKDGTEKIIEEKLSDISSETPLVSEDKLKELFDNLFPDKK